jgi:uncharacterized protein
LQRRPLRVAEERFGEPGLKLDLSEIAHSIGMHYTYEVVEDDSELESSGISLQEHVRGSLEFSNTGQLLLARGWLRATVRLECVRCLTSFPSLQEFAVEEQFALHPERMAGGAHEDEEDLFLPDDMEGPECLYQEGILDLTELIRQNLLVNIPFAPLCSEDCAGLCPRCGKNRNEGPCGCPEEDPGQRLSPLGELLSLLEDEETDGRG